MSVKKGENIAKEVFWERLSFCLIDSARYIERSTFQTVSKEWLILEFRKVSKTFSSQMFLNVFQPPWDYWKYQNYTIGISSQIKQIEIY